jgi:zinc transport system permease protein
MTDTLLQTNLDISVLIGGIIIAVLCGVVGIFVTLRKESFVPDAIAHASLAGVAVTLYIATDLTFIGALLVAIFMAIGIVYIKRNTNLSSDAVIGIFFSVLFAIGIIIISFNPEYELESYLFGSIEQIGGLDIIYSLIALFVIVVLVIIFYPKLVYMTLDPEAAFIRGFRVNMLEYILAILVAVTVVVSIKIVGIILVTALLIIPATTAKLLAQKYKHMLPISLAHSLISTILGIIIATYINTPPGATVVLVSGIIFVVIFTLKKLF